MANSFLGRIRKAWSVFRYGDDGAIPYGNYGPGYTTRPDRIRMYLGTERTITSAIFTRIGIDVASIPIKHVRLDENERYIDDIESGLNDCLSLEANIDQTGRAFIQDVVMSLCDEGVVAMVPVDTTTNPQASGSYDILTLRTAKILQWFPEHVSVNLYNQKIGQYQEITLPKRLVSVVENPLYSVMNEPNSILKRLTDKLNLLDAIDNQSGSGKLDLIIQLPYVVKTDARAEQADKRKTSIESQLTDSKYGIAYIDGTEKITQLNRPAENNLMVQIEYLTSMLYSQLGLTKEIFDGTADEQKLLNYYNRTIEPISAAISDGMERTFLTKTARSQGQAIMAIRDPFRLVPVDHLADIADKFTRNEILTGNEMRGVIGYQPSKDPEADELRNKNITQPDDEKVVSPNGKEPAANNQNGSKEVNYAKN